MAKNIGPFIVMCTRAYLTLVAKAAQVNPLTKDLQGITPSYFREQRAKMAGDQSALEAMLANDNYIVFPRADAPPGSVFMPRSMFANVYKSYCHDFNIHYKRLTSDVDNVS